MTKSTPRPKSRARRPPLPVRPSQPSEAVATIESHLIHQKLMGRAVLVWALLENCLQALIWAFLNLSMGDGRIITSRLDAGAMIPILRALGIRLLTPARLQEFLDLLITIDEYREDRNFIVHGTWFAVAPQSLPAAMSLRINADPGEVTSETFPADRMRNIVIGIEVCRQKVLSLEAELKTSRDKLIQQPPPD
jgi:hypothetical protein